MAGAAELEPTITLNNGSLLTNPQDYPAFDTKANEPSSHFTFTSARIAQAGANYPRSSMVAGVQNTSIYDNGTLAASWSSDAPILEIPLYANHGTLRLLVDGKEIIDADQSANSTPFAMPANNGAVKTICIDWTQAGGRQMRSYRAEVGGFFAGVRVGAGDVLNATPRPAQMRVAFVGDSYTEGAGTAATWDGYAALCARDLGVEPIFLGSGGTGYVTTPYKGRFPFIDRLGDLTSLSPPPDAIVVAGGTNDAVAPPVLSAAAAAYLKALKVSFPNAKIVIVGPWNPLHRSGGADADAIKESAQAEGLPFVDVRDWLPADNTADYIGKDRVHPTPSGHKYLAQRLATALRPLLQKK